MSTPTAAVTSVLSSQKGLDHLMQSVWRRAMGLAPGYMVTLNPDVEAEDRRLRGRQEALDEAYGLVATIEGAEVAAEELSRLSAEAEAQIKALPPIERVMAEGPNQPYTARIFSLLHGGRG